MLNGLKQKWGSMRPKTRQTATIMLVVGMFACIAVVLYLVTGEKKKPTIQLSEIKKTITVDPKLLEKTITVKADEQAGKIEELQKQITLMKSGGVVPQSATEAKPVEPAPIMPLVKSGQGLPGIPQPIGSRKGQSVPPPLPPGYPPQFGTLPPPPGSPGDMNAPPPREVIGDIEIVSNPGFKAVADRK